MWTDEYESSDLGIRDGVYGVVTSCCGTGVFLELENGESAFSFFGGLKQGDAVLCSVLKRATGSRKMLVAVDSVLREDGLAA